jgi:hypothetical protein
MIASAPKAYACLYENNDGSKRGEKIKFKGIPTTALTSGQRLTFDRVSMAYEEAGKHVAVLQGAPQMVKRPTKGEGEGMFSQIVDSNLRRGAPVSRTLFKTVW